MCVHISVFARDFGHSRIIGVHMWAQAIVHTHMKCKQACIQATRWCHGHGHYYTNTGVHKHLCRWVVVMTMVGV